MLRTVAIFSRDLQYAFRSLVRAKGLVLAVILTLALGIGANAAIFTLVRGVLLRPLVNRDEDRLIYIRQSAKGIGVENAYFSVPEIEDLKARVKSFSAFGDFSQIGFTMVGLGDPREIRSGVVGGTYFDVMGLHPVLGRLLDARDDGPNAQLPEKRSQRPREIGPLRSASRHHRRRAGTLRAVPGRDRNHRQRRNQPASPFSHHEDRTGASHDGDIRPSGAGCNPRSGDCRATHCARGNAEGTSGSVPQAG